MSSCANCSRFDHVKLDCPVMAIQGHGRVRQGPLEGLTRQGQPNFPGPYPNNYYTHVFNNNPSQHVGFRRNNDQPYPPSYNAQQQHQQPYANKKIVVVRPADATTSLHACSTSDRSRIRSDPQSNLAINGENDEDKFTREHDSRLRQEVRPASD